MELEESVEHSNDVAVLLKHDNNNNSQQQQQQADNDAPKSRSKAGSNEQLIEAVAKIDTEKTSNKNSTRIAPSNTKKNSNNNINATTIEIKVENENNKSNNNNVVVGDETLRILKQKIDYEKLVENNALKVSTWPRCNLTNNNNNLNNNNNSLKKTHKKNAQLRCAVFAHWMEKVKPVRFQNYKPSKPIVMKNINAASNTAQQQRNSYKGFFSFIYNFLNYISIT
jgi:hypothetical protein